jgi:hypothetical protein
MKNIVGGIMGNTLRRYLIVALVASMAITGGMFAYAYTTSSVSMTASGTTTDFASISGCTTGAPSFNTFGSYRGAIPAGYLFDVTPTAGYTGDLGVNVYLDNIDQIGYKYGLFMIKLGLVENSTNGSMDKDGISKVLSLNNGAVSFISDNLTPGTTYNILVKGGVFRTYPHSYLSSGIGGSFNPSFTAEVLQAGM